MKLLYDTITESLKPYPRYDDEPVVGLEPRYLEMTVIQDPEPSYDPQTQYINQTETINTQNKTVTKGWEIVSLPPAPPPPPDYISFYTALVQSQVYQQVLTQATQSTELLAYLLAFTSALSDAKSGRPNPPEIQNSINLIMGAITLSPQELQELGGLMSQHHLDQVYTLP